MNDKETLLPNIEAESQEPLLPQENALDSSQRTRPQYGNSCVVGTFGLLLAFILLGPTVIYNLAEKPNKINCQTPTVRREWRTLSLEARQKYVLAIQCLSNRPSRLGLNTTRYDDFVYSHLAVADDTHGTPVSLPWHRVYVQRYEDALRNECGYEDSLPYWDWSLDVSNPTHAPVWSNEYGLGGNGSSPNNCLVDGPLARMKPQYPEAHCLKRNFSDENMHGAEYTVPIVKGLITNASTYHDFRLRLEQGPHRYIHLAIGGEMPELWSSNDPIFFLHHAQIDRLWWRWQRQGQDGQFRGYNDIGDLDSHNDNATISVQDELKFTGLGDDTTTGDVISTETSLLCYRYE